MEPISSAAIAIATLILNKASEKTGEKLGEAVSHQVGKLAQLVKGKAPKAAAIEQPEQTVDYGQAVLELENATEKDPELLQTVQELAAAVQVDPKLAEKVTTYAAALKQSQPTTTQNYAKLADKIGIVLHGGGSVSIENFNF